MTERQESPGDVRPPGEPPQSGLPADETDLEYGDPYEGMEFQAFDPATQVSIPQGTPLGTGAETQGEHRPFDERYREDFEGLAFLGALSASFSYIGHKFVIRTLTVDEILAAGMLIKDFEGSPGDSRAYATAMVALSVVSVDGIGLPSPHAESEDAYAWARQRFEYVKARWFPFTVDYVYERYLLLEERTRVVLMEMTGQIKKSSGQGS